MSPPKIFFYFCLFFVLGILNGSFFHFSLFFLKFLIVWGLVVFLFFKRIPCLSFLGLLVFSLNLGAFYYFFQESKLNDLNFLNKEIYLYGKIVEEPEKNCFFNRLVVKDYQSKQKILLIDKSGNNYYYGDEVFAKGILKKSLFPSPAKGIFYQLDEAQIVLLNRSNSLRGALINLKNNLKENLNYLFSPPYSGFFKALIFGEEKDLSRVYLEKLNQTGTRHLIAVSGMNITIISQIIFIFFLNFGLNRKWAILVSLILIFVFILMIGFPSSAVRAGLMIVLLFWAQLSGKLVKPERLIVFVLFLMLLENPFLLRYDLGFQLSFASFVGLIYLKTFFFKLLKFLPSWGFLQIKENLSATLSAVFLSFPLLIYNFGKFPLISFLVNLLVLPLIPFLTLWGIALSFLFFFYQNFAFFLGLLVFPFVFYVEKVISFFASFPLNVSFSLSSFGIALFYLFVSFLICRKSKKEPFFIA